MKIQLHVGTKADLSFNLRHFWPMKSFRRPRLYRKTDYHFKISGVFDEILRVVFFSILELFLSYRNEFVVYELKNGNIFVDGDKKLF